MRVEGKALVLVLAYGWGWGGEISHPLHRGVNFTGGFPQLRAGLSYKISMCRMKAVICTRWPMQHLHTGGMGLGHPPSGLRQPAVPRGLFLWLCKDATTPVCGCTTVSLLSLSTFQCQGRQEALLKNTHSPLRHVFVCCTLTTVINDHCVRLLSFHRLVAGALTTRA